MAQVVPCLFLGGWEPGVEEQAAAGGGGGEGKCLCAGGGGGGAEAAGPAVLPLRGVVLGLRGAGRGEGKRGAGVGAASCRPKKWGKR